MAFLQSIRNFLIPTASRGITVVEPAAPTHYSVKPLVHDNLDEVLRLNFRCFENGENYTKHTFSYLLSQSNALCFQVLTAEKRMAGFLCVLVGEDGIAHITTIGVAPEHRRRGLAGRLLDQLDQVLIEKGVASIVLEVRVGNVAAQQLYKSCGFSITQRLSGYYNDGEDGFLMIKGLTGDWRPADISQLFDLM
jgi:ribosomal-protein-alanine N-acetyltransferase